MKTTVVLPDPLFRALKGRAAEMGLTLSTLMTDLLQRGLQQSPPVAGLPSLPSFDAGAPRVNVADRDALYQRMEEA